MVCGSRSVISSILKVIVLTPESKSATTGGGTVVGCQRVRGATPDSGVDLVRQVSCYIPTLALLMVKMR